MKPSSDHDSPRRFIRRVVANLGVVVLLAGTMASTAEATSSTGTDAGIDDDHIFAGVSYHSDDSLARCEWSLPLPSYGLGARVGATTREWNGITWVLHQCTRDGVGLLVWLPDVTEDVVADTTRDAVRERVPALSGLFSPPPSNGVVKTPLWFWVPAALWRPISVTASVPTPRGVISMTTTATPVTLEFDPGDGTRRSVSCDGPGSPWSPLLGPTAESSCSYDFPRPSTRALNGVFRTRLSVVWEVTWRSNLGAFGRLPDLRLTSSTAMRVRELQTVVVR